MTGERTPPPASLRGPAEQLRALVESTVAEAAKTIETLRGELAEASARNAELAADRNRLLAELARRDQQRESFAEADARSRELQRELDRCRSSEAELRSEAGRLAARCQELETELTAERERAHGSAADRAVLEEELEALHDLVDVLERAAGRSET